MTRTIVPASPDPVAAVAPAAGGPPAAVVGVFGATGGLGVSCLAVALAVRLTHALSGEVALVDADPSGGGLDLLLGCEHEPGLRWSALAGVSGTVDGAGLIAQLPRAHGVAVLSHEVLDPLAAAQAPTADQLGAVVRGLATGASAVVVGGSRWPGPPGLVDHLDESVLLVGSGVHQLAAAAGLAVHASLPGSSGDSPGLVLRTGGRNAAAPERVAEHLDLPLLGTLGEDRGLDADLTSGLPPGHRVRGALSSTATQVIDALALGPARRRRAGGRR